MNATLYKKEQLIENVLFFDGITRGGKGLISKIISNFLNVEYFQNIPILEQIPVLHFTKLLNDENAIALLRLNLDVAVYDMCIGRGLNSRKEDQSSYLHSYDPGIYTERENGPEKHLAVDKIIEKKRMPSFLMHETMINASIIFKALPKLKIIHIDRHPVDLVDSWDRKKWGDRWGNDPYALIPALSIDNKPYPWFSLEWNEEYFNLNPIDRIIKSIVTIKQLESAGYNKLEPIYKQQALLVNYENVIPSTWEFIDQVSNFLDGKPCKTMNKILSRENCLRDLSLEERKEKLQKIKLQAQPEYYKLLLQNTEEYEKKWLLPSIL